MKHILLLLVLILNKNAVAEAQCDIANQHESYVFAITWQPGFCRSHKNNQGCKGLEGDAHARTNFTLHGLWPQKDGCQSNYAFCSEVKSLNKFCSLPPVSNISSQVATEVLRVMPNARGGGCLDRHEWWKHGACSGLSEDGYFRASLALLDNFNRFDFVRDFIRLNIGKKVTRRAFYKALEDVFGNGVRTQVVTRCGKGGYLEEIQMKLPKALESESDLALLMREGPSGRDTGNCKDQLLIAAATSATAQEQQK